MGRGTGQYEREQDNARRQIQSEDRDNTRQGDNTQLPLPPFNGTTQPTRGGRQHTDGRHRHSTGRPATLPPFTHHATHHPLYHPTIHNGPTLHQCEGGTDRGYPTTRTPQTHTHHPHTTHLARNSTRHDSSTDEYCNGMSGARATPLHWAGQQQHAPPPFHTPRRMDTIHSSTHLLSHCSRSHNQRTTMINEQQSMFND